MLASISSISSIVYGDIERTCDQNKVGNVKDLDVVTEWVPPRDRDAAVRAGAQALLSRNSGKLKHPRGAGPQGLRPRQVPRAIERDEIHGRPRGMPTWPGCCYGFGAMTIPMFGEIRMSRTLSIVVALSLCGCAATPPNESPPSPPAAVVPQVQIVPDPELERRVAQLEIQLIERDALIESLNARLDQALKEVVGTMGRLRSLATRAEAASAMAEADVALKSTGNPARDSKELKQASRLMQQSADEFKRQNFGGALYLANQAKMLARLHGVGGEVGKMRPKEVAFAGPVKLRASMRANVRVGPGMSFPVAFATGPGSALSGVSYLGEWIRVTDETGSEGWIFGSLVSRLGDQSP
jgi:uncharacterized coiled-coil protein SlyX